MKIIRFDDSLPAMVGVLRTTLGDEAVVAGTILRDAVGCLAFFANEALDEEKKSALSVKLREALGSYARPDRAVAGGGDYGAIAVKNDLSALYVEVDGLRIRLVDRRIVGADWLHAPAPPPNKPSPRIVFASLKGGVGRSTALVIVAKHMASKHGLRVLAIDLDMEAPGLGALLFPPKNVPESGMIDASVPEFGMIDALVENGLTGLDDAFYADLVGASEFAGTETRGRIHVIPAFGQRSLRNPADVLAKIARAYAEDIRPDGTVVTMLDQVRAIVDHFADSGDYDAILVDARAGLHESTASAIMGLGAEILLFGLNEAQTFQGYKALLSHLARFRPRGDDIPEWLERLTMIQGKAPVDADERAEFVEKCSTLFSESGLSARARGPVHEIPLPAGPFDKVPWDEEQSDEQVLRPTWSGPEPLAILNDERFQGFDPSKNRDLLSESIYHATFGQLLDWVDMLVTGTFSTSMESMEGET